MSRGLGSGQGDNDGASGLLELWGSSDHGGRIGQRLDKLFDPMICTMEIYFNYDPLSLVVELKG